MTDSRRETNKAGMTDDVASGMVFLQVPHIMQSELWDCGLACAKMVLNFVYPDVEDGPKDFSSTCERLGIRDSVWTIDLAYLVQQYTVRHKLYTITLGVNPTFESIPFYKLAIKDLFVSEQEGGNQLPANANSKDRITSEEERGNQLHDNANSKDRITSEEESGNQVSANASSKDRITSEEESGNQVSANASSKDRITSEEERGNQLPDNASSIDVFTSEQERVNQLFAHASSKGVNVEERSISHAEIVKHLYSHNPAIVLVDDTVLYCESCALDKSRMVCGINCFESRKEDDYIGHFIVLCGIDATKELFLYRNPGIPEELCCCSFDNFDKARRSHGTDEDILFVYR